MGFYFAFMKPTIEELYKIFLQNPVICTDTRNIAPGSLFFALRGDNFNANLFAEDALKKGCSYAIIDEKINYTHPNLIQVKDVLSTLQNLAKFHRNKLNIPVIGITGTNGKTTTKELINIVLSKKFDVIATRGNLNNHIGVPITILSIKRETGIAIIEMGANHPGEIKTLCEIARPNFGIITNIGKAHLEGFGSFQGVIDTKNELYQYIRNFQGEIFINADNSLLSQLSIEMKRIFYGTDTKLFSASRIVASNPFLEIEFFNKGKWELVKSNLVGAYNFENINAAFCIGRHFAVPINKIKEALEEYQPSNNRSQVIRTAKNTIIMDAYNANPSSMEAALENFSKTDLPAKVLLLGDMRELGSEAEKEHLKIIHLIEKNQFKEVILVGDIFCSIAGKKFNCFQTSLQAASWLEENPVTDKSILIKGSRGIQLEKILKTL